MVMNPAMVRILVKKKVKGNVVGREVIGKEKNGLVEG